MNDNQNTPPENPEINISEKELKEAISEKEIESEKESKEQIKIVIEKILKK